MKYINQSGRSMVETIGVLAVIGVLTIGAIAGYNYGINKHRANQILQDSRLIYQETKYPNTVRQIVETGEFPDMEIDPQSPYEYSFSFPSLDDFIYDSVGETEPNLICVNVTGVSKTACDILLKTKPSYVLMLKVNGQSVWTCDKSENELSYIFEITSDSLEYGTCSVCTGEHCFDDDLNCPEGEYCYNDTCSRCAHGYTENKSGVCQSCNFTRRTDLTQENCHRCGNMMYGYDPNLGGDTNCFPCSNVNISVVTKEYCQKCMDVNSNVMHLSGACVNCKSRFAFRNDISKANCSACGEINGNGQFAWYSHFNNLCVNCASFGATANTEHTECICPTNKVWIWDNNYSGCYACTSK
ncbi:MAG: hypothetical protein J6V11_04995, partial [Alphaproteobacteria bacterium]|nr:hypothetical protein [Alphaproteobacteria bacterium]